MSDPVVIYVYREMVREPAPYRDYSRVVLSETPLNEEHPNWKLLGTLVVTP
jgi:hypothetical protein